MPKVVIATKDGKEFQLETPFHVTGTFADVEAFSEVCGNICYVGDADGTIFYSSPAGFKRFPQTPPGLQYITCEVRSLAEEETRRSEGQRKYEDSILEHAAAIMQERRRPAAAPSLDPTRSGISENGSILIEFGEQEEPSE